MEHSCPFCSASQSIARVLAVQKGTHFLAGCLVSSLCERRPCRSKPDEATEGRNVTIHEEATAACLQYRRIAVPG